MSDNLPVTAVAGAPPPFVETTQPLQPDAGGIHAADGTYESPRERARRNERTLEPLRFPTPGGIAEAVTAAAAGQLDPFYQRLKDEQAAPLPAAPVHTIRRIKRATGVVRPPVPVEAIDPLQLHGLEEIVGVLANGPMDISVPYQGQPRDVPLPVVEDLSHAPAASNTDSPARGVPRDTGVPMRAGKEITGGFGDEGALSYFALNGRELRVLVEQLMDEVHARLQNDLRFNEALVYPQVSARVVIEIAGYVRDNDFIIDKFLPTTHEARTHTPVEIARTVADEICFVVLAERRETDDEGQSLIPPDALRDELGLVKPRKRMITTGPGQTSMVDVG